MDELGPSTNAPATHSPTCGTLPAGLYESLALKSSAHPVSKAFRPPLLSSWMKVVRQRFEFDMSQCCIAIICKGS
jgi:hypothetical protein